MDAQTYNPTPCTADDIAMLQRALFTNEFGTNIVARPIEGIDFDETPDAPKGSWASAVWAKIIARL